MSLKYRLNIVAFFFLSLLVIVNESSCRKDSNISSSNDSYFSEFHENWNRYSLSTFGGWKSNDSGRFSWDDAYALEGLCLNYERSFDKRYLDTFIELSKKILLSSDSARSIKDAHRNFQILPGWSSKRYTKDSSYHIFGVTNAMILYPIVWMYNIYKEKGDLNDKRFLTLTKLLEFAKNEFKKIQENDYVYINDTIGYFHDPYYKSIGIETPINQFCRVGAYSLELYKATGERKYKELARGVANLVKQNLIDTLSYAYWYYYPRINTSISNTVEDLGHSILVIQFIVVCYEQNLVFNFSDIKKLINLFNNQVYDGSKYFKEFLQGSQVSSDPFFSHYYLLSKYDRSISNQLNEWISRNSFDFNPNSFLNHFGNKLILLSAFKNYYSKY